MFWACLLHLYQPPWQKKKVLKKIIQESYQPILKILERNRRVKITLNICGSLTDLLMKNGFQKIIKKIEELVRNNQIELTSSAKYHPILPLCPKAEVIRQIKLNETTNQKYFRKSWRPKGFFLPELAYDKKTARIIKFLGYQWLILDEIAYTGKIGEVNFEKRYQIKDLRLKVIFRNRGLSDIFFTGWLNSERRFWQALKNDNRSDKFLITAFDGENLGHHKPGTERIFEILVKKIKTLTISELLGIYQKEEIVNPLSSSWSSKTEELKSGIPFSLWRNPQNKIHQLQWQLTNFVINQVDKSKKDQNFQKARKALDQALNSCQYWWASATPWWSLEIITESAKKLVKVLKILKKIDQKIIHQAERVKEKIILMAQDWQNSGYVNKLKESYLKNGPSRYFGGRVIK
ncbi:MAG: hypothetical protein N2259_03240 [Patescibacteria group bacterium]|nr:hypothetical protein [Patescibacteria group bacterium]